MKNSKNYTKIRDMEKETEKEEEEKILSYFLLSC